MNSLNQQKTRRSARWTHLYPIAAKTVNHLDFWFDEKVTLVITEVIETGTKFQLCSLTGCIHSAGKSVFFFHTVCDSYYNSLLWNVYLQLCCLIPLLQGALVPHTVISCSSHSHSWLILWRDIQVFVHEFCD